MLKWIFYNNISISLIDATKYITQKKNKKSKEKTGEKDDA